MSWYDSVPPIPLHPFPFPFPQPCPLPFSPMPLTHPSPSTHSLILSLISLPLTSRPLHLVRHNCCTLFTYRINKTCVFEQCRTGVEKSSSDSLLECSLERYPFTIANFSNPFWLPYPDDSNIPHHDVIFRRTMTQAINLIFELYKNVSLLTRRCQNFTIISITMNTISPAFPTTCRKRGFKYGCMKTQIRVSKE